MKQLDKSLPGMIQQLEVLGFGGNIYGDDTFATDGHLLLLSGNTQKGPLYECLAQDDFDDSRRIPLDKMDALWRREATRENVSARLLGCAELKSAISIELMLVALIGGPDGRVVSFDAYKLAFAIAITGAESIALPAETRGDGDSLALLRSGAMVALLMPTRHVAPNWAEYDLTGDPAPLKVELR